MVSERNEILDVFNLRPIYKGKERQSKKQVNKLCGFLGLTKA